MKKWITVFILFLLTACQSPQIHIVIKENPSRLEKLAAHQVRRYIYLSSGEYPQIVEQQVKGGVQISIISTEHSFGLKKDEFLLRKESPSQFIIAGGSDISTLYAAFEFAEQLGVRFYLHGDVLPEKARFRLPDIDKKMQPLFDTRGIQPFHDFPEGPDWWNADDYKAYFDQMVKMKMNWFGLHTYPDGAHGPEPLVWIGEKKNVNADGSVNFSYPARHYTTTGPTDWGYNRMKTSDYVYGCSVLYPQDNYGADYMTPYSPHEQIGDYYWPVDTANKIDYEPHTLSDWNTLFNSMGEFLDDVFSFGKEIGLQFCIGTETKLTIPEEVAVDLQKQGKDPHSFETVADIYEGMFERIKRTHPLDYYWFWTPEDWTWRDNTPEEEQEAIRDMQAAIQAIENIGSPFKLATSGWVLGPKSDRSLFDRFLPKSMPMSCINRNVGFEPVEPDFAKTTGRPLWAIPWMEDDPAMIVPQLWAGRMRRDAADALAYGCSGLIGIHWRTRVIGPNVSALARAGWEQTGWNVSAGESMSYEQAVENAKNEQRDLPVKDFYLDWAQSQFGKKAGNQAAAIFAKLDGGLLTKMGEKKLTHLPRPSEWKRGPGGIEPDTTAWDVRQNDYLFIQKFAELEPLLNNPEQRERFVFWLHQFNYLCEVGHFACQVAEMDKLLSFAFADSNADKKQQILTEKILPLRKQQIETVGNVLYHLVATVNTPGALGNVTNWQQHVMCLNIYQPGEQIAALLDKPLPDEYQPPKEMQLPIRMIVPTIRSSLQKGEALKLTIIYTGQDSLIGTVNFSDLGELQKDKINLQHVHRGVYQAILPANSIQKDFEYFITAKNAVGQEFFWPPAGGQRPMAVVVFE